MNYAAVLSEIYPEVDQLTMFPHPKTGRTYTMLCQTKLVELAERTLAMMMSMNIDQIIVSESGAVPFARVCAWISDKKQLPLKWYAIKVPRDISQCFNVTYQTYLSLTKQELILSNEIVTQGNSLCFSNPDVTFSLPENYFNQQEKKLREIIDTIEEEVELPGCMATCKNSGLAQILSKPFIFFDEFIDSGKTIFQTFRFLKLFNTRLDFKIVSYLIKLSKDEINSVVCQSLYTLDNEELAFQWGVYPFENRMDWLGYFYRIDCDYYHRINLAELSQYNSEGPDNLEKYLDLVEQIFSGLLLNELKNSCRIAAVSAFISRAHIIQYSLYLLERNEFGVSEFSEFYYQIFDLYGPIWSPLPDDYHLSYLEVFEQYEPFIEDFLKTKSINETYKNIRFSIIRTIAALMDKRRIHQQQSLLTFLEKNYAS